MLDLGTSVAWLAVNASGSAVDELMRIAWRSVGAICEWVAAEAGREADLLAGLRRRDRRDLLARLPGAAKKK